MATQVNIPDATPQAPISHERTSRDRRKRIFGEKVLPRIVLISMSILFLLPFYWMIATALKTNAELAAYPPTLFPKDPQWSNFIDATRAFPFWRFAKNSAVITSLTILGAIISNPIIAYGFSRIDWPGRDKVFMLVLATVFVPFPVLTVALFDIFAKLQWINTPLPLVVPMFFGNAFWIFLMRQFMLQIPRDLSDAARMDGANEFQIFWQIILPQTIPAIGVIAIFAGVASWDDFLGPLIYLQDSTTYTLAIGLTYFQQTGGEDVQFNLLMAASTLIVLPVIVLFLFFQNVFTEGITVSGLKG